MLGPGNEEVAKQILAVWPGEFHVGGGITLENALEWIESGAEKVLNSATFDAKIIVTSYLFDEDTLNVEKLKAISSLVGKNRLVVDLSCKRVKNQWKVAINKWKTLTDLTLDSSKILEISRRIHSSTRNFSVVVTVLRVRFGCYILLQCLVNS
jgi:phosphoribosylformimino-5-aminoimidazole carboxamide ribotide isomerase